MLRHLSASQLAGSPQVEVSIGLVLLINQRIWQVAESDLYVFKHFIRKGDDFTTWFRT